MYIDENKLKKNLSAMRDHISNNLPENLDTETVFTIEDVWYNCQVAILGKEIVPFCNR